MFKICHTFCQNRATKIPCATLSVPLYLQKLWFRYAKAMLLMCKSYGFDMRKLCFFIFLFYLYLYLYLQRALYTRGYSATSHHLLKNNKASKAKWIWNHLKI